MFKSLSFAALFTVSCFLTLTLYGQNNTTQPSSIVGFYFYRTEPSASTSVRFTFDNPVSNAEVVLIADGDTLKTSTSPGGLEAGEFEFSGITYKLVTLSLECKSGYDPNADSVTPYQGSFELMPGKNIVYIPTERVDGRDLFLSSKVPIITMKGDTWVYHFADMKTREEDYIVEMLGGMPGVVINKRKGQVTISGNAVHKTEVNGAYVFALDPATQ